MKYVAFVGTEGGMPEEAVAVMNRGFPAYFEEMDRRGVRLFGRELELPSATDVTVRMREGDMLVTDGPFAETKEFVGGFDLLDCADLDEAIEVTSKNPVARFLPCEIRPLPDGLRLGPGASAFERHDDSAGIPYLLSVWASEPARAPLDARVLGACEAWRQELEARGTFVLGAALGGPETATTLRHRAGETQLSDGPFLDLAEFIAGIDVVTCAHRQQAIELAATHPLARFHTIEVRPFYSQSAHAG